MDSNERLHTYIAIDLKSFYASVECVERHLDPLTARLVVADTSRTEKTICLAVSPALKAYGIPGRCRLFELEQEVSRQNIGPYIVAKPRMHLYMEYSARIYRIYLKYVAPEDVYVYSVDEVFIDATGYLHAYGYSAREMAMQIVREIKDKTGITATAGIGTNLYLCKIAMDIMAKRLPADENGVRIAQLDEISYRRRLWLHRPLSDFWRIGKGYERRLRSVGIDNMGEVARCSLEDEDLLYHLFGVNAEFLIDHAWGWEPCTMQEIRSQHPKKESLGTGQVLQRPYTAKEGRLALWEMAQLLALQLTEKGLLSNQLTLTVGYDVKNLQEIELCKEYHGKIVADRYGRLLPHHAHGTIHLDGYFDTAVVISQKAVSLYDRIINPELWVRRLVLTAENVRRRKAAGIAEGGAAGLIGGENASAAEGGAAGFAEGEAASSAEGEADGSEEGETGACKEVGESGLEAQAMEGRFYQPSLFTLFPEAAREEGQKDEGEEGAGKAGRSSGGAGNSGDCGSSGGAENSGIGRDRGKGRGTGNGGGRGGRSAFGEGWKEGSSLMEQEGKTIEKEEKMQKAVLSIQRRYGKNAILKAANLEEGGRTIERNQEIGGHRA